jgi:hypothetical protein
MNTVMESGRRVTRINNTGVGNIERRHTHQTKRPKVYRFYATCMYTILKPDFTRWRRQPPWRIMYSAAAPLAGAPGAVRAHDDIIVPELVSTATIRLPAPVDTSNLGLDARALPLRGVGVRGSRLGRQAGDGLVVEPGFDSAVGPEVVLEAHPRVGRQRLGGGDALRRQVRQRGVVRLAVVHEDAALAADAQVLLGALRGVGHSHEGHVGGVKGSRGFSGVKFSACALLMIRKHLQPCPDIDVALGNLRRAEEDVSAEAARSVDPHGVLTRMRRSSVERDFAALVAVRGVRRPRGLVPTTLETLGDLAEGEGQECQGEAYLAQHFWANCLSWVTR